MLCSYNIPRNLIFNIYSRARRALQFTESYLKFSSAGIRVANPPRSCCTHHSTVVRGGAPSKVIKYHIIMNGNDRIIRSESPKK